jgi:hypothetical protein
MNAGSAGRSNYSLTAIGPFLVVLVADGGQLRRPSDIKAWTSAACPARARWPEGCKTCGEDLDATQRRALDTLGS